MSEIISRLKAETPTFFKNMRLFGVWLMATSAALLMAPESIELPVIVIECSRHAAGIGFVISTVASFAKKDTKDA